MSGFIPLLAKEFLEIRRTWRLWVVPGILAFFAVTGPIMALLTPRLLASMAAQQPGVVITVPDPTAVDAYAQFVKGLMQMVLLALIIGGGGLVSGERASGTAIMVLTKPVSRAAFILSKLVAELALLLAATMLTTGGDVARDPRPLSTGACGAALYRGRDLARTRGARRERDGLLLGELPFARRRGGGRAGVRDGAAAVVDVAGGRAVLVCRALGGDCERAARGRPVVGLAAGDGDGGDGRIRGGGGGGVSGEGDLGGAWGPNATYQLLLPVAAPAFTVVQFLVVSPLVALAWRDAA
ncbi:MAG: ABC transporter permease [Gemmatimonadetes bacterium]|nr:ABC transporter permease [Gemmatimonadota bacterium]